MALWQRKPIDWRFAMPGPDVLSRAAAHPPLFEVLLETRLEAGHAHSPSLHETGDGALSTYWFDGTREGATDVVITGRLVRSTSGAAVPGPERDLISAPDIEARLEPAQTIRKLGNSLIATVPSGGDLLFTTTVSYGGWAMSKIAVMPLSADGRPSGPSRHLPVTPLLNRSALVRAPGIAYADGTLGLPIYIEQAGRFGELLRIDASGRVLAKARMSHGVGGIQPTIVPLDERRAVAFLRNFRGRRDELLSSRSEDGGRSWGPLIRTGLASLNSPAAATRLASGAIALVYNEGRDRRDRLVVALSTDEGRTFRTVHVLEDGVVRPGDARYPSLERLEDGTVALAYSIRSRGGIRVVRFSEAWVAAGTGGLAEPTGPGGGG